MSNLNKIDKNENETETETRLSCEEIIKSWETNAYLKQNFKGGRNARGYIDNNELFYQPHKFMDIQWYSLYCSTLNEAVRKRQNTLKKYTINTVITQQLNKKSYIWINQGNTSACSVASFINCCQLAKLKPYWNYQSFKNEEGFRLIYKEAGVENLIEKGMTNWKIAMKCFCGLGYHFAELLKHFSYFPFKLRSGMRNIDLSTKMKHVSDMTHNEYAECIIKWIITKLNIGHILAIPFLNHFITIIGYCGEGINTQFLFLGSFGPTCGQGGLHELHHNFDILKFADSLSSCIYINIR
jgi:hypothetical protein